MSRDLVLRRLSQERYKERHPDWWKGGDQDKRRERSRRYMAKKRQDPKYRKRHREWMRAYHERKKPVTDAEVEAYLEAWSRREDEREARGHKKPARPWSSREEFYRLIGLGGR